MDKLGETYEEQVNEFEATMVRTMMSMLNYNIHLCEY